MDLSQKGSKVTVGNLKFCSENINLKFRENIIFKFRPVKSETCELLDAWSPVISSLVRPNDTLIRDLFSSS